MILHSLFSDEAESYYPYSVRKVGVKSQNKGNFSASSEKSEDKITKFENKGKIIIRNQSGDKNTIAPKLIVI